MDGSGKIQIHTVIFDYGNVLSLPQSLSDIRAMAAICALPVERLREIYWELRPAYDCNQLNGRTYWASLLREGNQTASETQISELITLDIRSWLHIDQETMSWARSLHEAGVRIAILSSMPFELARYIEANCAWSAGFEQRIFSCDLGRVKPDPSVYDACLKRLNTSAGEVLFLDDKAANIAGAESVGIHGVLFDDLKNVSRIVERLYELGESR